MKTSSIHFKPVSGNSEVHNFREVVPDYVLKEVPQKNLHISFATIAAKRLEIEKLYQEKVGQKMQKKATPIREAVIVLDTESFKDELGKYGYNGIKENLKKLREALLEKYGIDCFQTHVHLDEGKKIEGKETPIWERNLHAHMIFDWQDKKTGKSIKLNRRDMSDIQTITADTLSLKRGEKWSKSERLEHGEFRKKMEELDKKFETRKQQLGEELMLKKAKLQKCSETLTRSKSKLELLIKESNNLKITLPWLSQV